MKDMKSLGEKSTDGNSTPQGWISEDMIQSLADLLNNTGLSEIEIEQGGARIRVARQVSGTIVAPAPVAAAPVPAAAPAAPAAATPAGPAEGSVPSPMVGTAYLSPEPGKPAFVKVGDTVKEGDTILIVEAMKTMNPIPAPRAGTVKEICVHDAEPVEFGQPLIVIA